MHGPSALRTVFFLSILLAQGAFWPVVEDGSLVGVLYREPKLAVLQVGFSALWIALLAHLSLSFGALLKAADVARAPFGFLAAFVAWSGLTGLWARVAENWWYEQSQWLGVLLCVVLIRAWASRDDGLRDLVVGSVVTAGAAGTLVGLLQGSGAQLPGLLPVSPELGVSHASWMGFKNPMALLILSQIHLVAWLRLRASAGPPARRVAWSCLLAVELLYLATLQSRTAWIAFAAGVPVAVALALRSRLRGGSRPRGVAWAAVAVTAVLLAAFLPGTRERVAGLVSAAREQVVELRGDRAVYLLNTLEMVRSRPFGVGAGNWQVWYPVYRTHERDLGFDETVQVRRAHGDHTQVLGETGWTGLGLWFLTLGGAIGVAWRSTRDAKDQADRVFGPFLALQIGTIAVAGFGDYFLDLPTHRFQLALLLALVALPHREAGASVEEPARDRRGLRVFPAILQLALVLQALAGMALFARSDAAARVEVSWRLGGLRPGTATEIDLATHGARFLSLPGHEKTFHRTYLALARVADLAGSPGLARDLAASSLRLHPFSPNAFGFLATSARGTDSREEARFVEAWDYVLHQATHGFLRPYPDLPPERTRHDLAREWKREILAAPEILAPPGRSPPATAIDSQGVEPPPA